MNPALERQLITALSLAETFLAGGNLHLAADMLRYARVLIAKLEAKP